MAFFFVVAHAAWWIAGPAYIALFGVILFLESLVEKGKTNLAKMSQAPSDDI